MNSEQPPVVILAAGDSNRMFPINTKRKAFLQLHGMTLIGHTISRLVSAGYKQVVVILSSEEEGTALKEETGQLPNLELITITQPQAKGMGDALLRARQHVTFQFLVIAPYHFGAPDIFQQLLSTGNTIAVTTSPTDTPWRYGIVELENDRIKSIVEKPERGKEPSNQKLQACYLLNHQFLDELELAEKDHYNFEKTLNDFAKKVPITAVQLTEPLPTLKYPWDLFSMESALFAGAQSYQAPSAQVAATAVIDDSQGPVIIGEQAVIGHAAKLVGPCFVGRNTLIGDFSFVRHSSIGSDVRVGANSEVVRSIMMPKTDIHLGYLADSIVDSDTTISAGLLTANKRLDRQPIVVTTEGKKFKTNRRALGIVIGAQCNVGIRVSTMPGLLIGSGSTIYPSVTMYDSVPINSIVKDT